MKTTTTTKDKAIQSLVLRVGQQVKWRSGSNGNFKTKKGKVVAIVAAGKILPKTKFPTLAKTATPRKQASYVIDVNGRFYFPRPTQLQKA